MTRRTMTVLAVASLLSACVQLRQPAPEVHDYRLDYPPPTVTGTPLPVTLRVSRVGVAAVYDREPIVYREGSYATGTYFYHRWSTNPGDMITDLLARDLADSGLYRAVQQNPSVIPIDYQLNGEIEEIEERTLDNACAAHLRLRIVLTRVRNPTADPVVLRNGYSADEPCPCNEARPLAQAMSHAMARLSAQLQQETYDAIRKSNGE